MTIRLEFFAVPGCSRCAQAKTALEKVVQDFDATKVQWREVDILQEMDYAIELGIVGASAMAIDGELVFPQLPGPQALRAELLNRLNRP
jgi:thioredoxin 1